MIVILTLSVVSVMFRLEKEGPRFHLSGVGELRPTHKVSLPQDEDEMILWNHRSESQHAPLIPNFVSTPAYPLRHLLGDGYHKAFPMHERCWHLMTRILDVELIKKDMDIFFRAMCEPQRVTWREVNSSHVPPVYKEWLEFISGLTPISYLIPLRFRAKDDANPSHMPRHFRSADPLNDSYMKNLIAKYTAKYTKQREKGFEPVSQYSSPTHTMSRRSQATFKPRNVLLPTELILNIADYLEHHKDIQTLLWVFPRWHSMIPDSYWRRRFIDDNYLENNQFPPADALDWQHVYLNTDKLLRPSWGWRNRQRILSRLEETKARFLQQLEQKEIQD